MESVKDRIKREHEAASKMLPAATPERLKRQQAEHFANARAWIQVAQRLGRPLTAREQESLNI
jgi:hypothetical protein